MERMDKWAITASPLNAVTWNNVYKNINIYKNNTNIYSM
jgi:hypothetical protein